MTSHLAVLTLEADPSAGGVQRYVYEIVRRLAREIRVELVTPAASMLPPETELHSIVPGRANAFGFWHQLQLLHPDRVLIGHAHPQLMLAALAARLPYGIIVHGNDFLAAQQRWHRPIFNWLLRSSDPLITNSRATAALVGRLGSVSPAVIYPGTDPDRFTPAPTAPTGPPTLLTVGRLVPRKGLDTVLRALPALLSSFPELRYHIVGSGPDRARLEKLACTLNVVEAVTFLGHVANEVLPSTYRGAMIFVMPARAVPDAASIEGFGIVYLEASASGLPVVAGRSGGAVEAVKHEETGYLVDPDDPEDLADVLLTLLQNRALREKMGRAGRRWVEEEMNWDRAAEKYREILGLQ